MIFLELGLLLLPLLILSNAYAFEESIFYRGDIFVKGIENSYKPGESLNVTFELVNRENFPIFDAYLVIEVVYGAEKPYYPSQFSDEDTIIYEDIIENIYIAPKSSVEIPWSFKLPETLRDGIYRIDVFLVTKKAIVVGFPAILLPGAYKTFIVEGYGEFPCIRILRTKTEFGGYKGPVGTPAEPSSEISANVFVENYCSEKIKDLKLKLDICKWTDTPCERVSFYETTFSIEPKSTKEISINISAPKKPDAYAVRIVVADNKGNVHSIYRSRIIVKGATAKIRKMYLDGISLEANKKRELFVLVSGSPDHYTKPNITNVELYSFIKDLKADRIVEEFVKKFPLIRTGDLIMVNFSFIPTTDLYEFEVCSFIRKNSEILDNYCYNVSSKAFTKSKGDYSFKFSYFIKDSQLFLNICSYKFNLPVNTTVSSVIFSCNNTLLLYKEKLILNPCNVLMLNLDKKNLECKLGIVDENGKKHDFTLSLKEEFTRNETRGISETAKPENVTTIEIKGKGNKKLIFLMILVFIVIIGIIIRKRK